MNTHKKLNLIKSFDRHPIYSWWSGHHVKFNVLGDLFFHDWLGVHYLDEDDDIKKFTYSSWYNLSREDCEYLEKERMEAPPSNKDVIDWCDKWTHNRWAQMRKLARMGTRDL